MLRLCDLMSAQAISCPDVSKDVSKPLSTKKATLEIACGGMVEGAFHPHRVNWVIRLTSPHLPYGSGSNRGCLTGETNDVVRSYGFALTEQASVTLLMPRRNHCSPGNGVNGAERNRTAVRNTGVDHLVRKIGRCHSDRSGGLEHNRRAS